MTDNEMDEEFNIPRRKQCPMCLKGTMELFKDVEHDERPCGDEFSGDFELGSCRTVYYECNNKQCKHDEVIDQEFKGSGILR
jgi:hypothetical protein